jgi:preprotein translocase subunit SecA
VLAMIQDMRHSTVEAMVEKAIPNHAYSEQWNTAGLHEECLRIFGLDLPVVDWAKEEGIAEEAIHTRISEAVEARVAAKEETYGAETMRMVERSVLLNILDQTWKEHLLALDHLRQGINLRAYAQRDPLNEYKREAFEMFEQMLEGLREQVTSLLARVEMRSAAAEMPVPRPVQMTAVHPAFEEEAGEAEQRPTGTDGPTSIGPAGPRVARNAPCPCGSGKKFKHCHGRV